ncbi:hypothetical protein V8B97DRAFT_1914586 [Scleroderma yunnanense]
MADCCSVSQQSTPLKPFNWSAMFNSQMKCLITGGARIPNDNLAMSLLFHSKLKPKAERDTLDSLYMQHLEETDAKLSWLAMEIVQTEQQMRFLKVVTKSRDAMWEGWVTSVQDQWLYKLAQ